MAKTFLRATMLALLGMSCSTTIAAHRPLSDAAIAALNQSIEGRQASVVLETVKEPDQRAER
jgi:hypothetical protein